MLKQVLVGFFVVLVLVGSVVAQEIPELAFVDGSFTAPEAGTYGYNDMKVKLEEGMVVEETASQAIRIGEVVLRGNDIEAKVINGQYFYSVGENGVINGIPVDNANEVQIKGSSILGVSQEGFSIANGLEVGPGSSFRYNQPTQFRKIAALELTDASSVLNVGGYSGRIHGEGIQYEFGEIDGYGEFEQGELVSVAGQGKFEEYSLESGEKAVMINTEEGQRFINQEGEGVIAKGNDFRIVKGGFEADLKGGRVEIEPPFEKNVLLKFGDKDVSEDGEIRRLQAMLNSLGYKGEKGRPLKVDGDFGGNTEFALKAYQKDLIKKGLYEGAVDGILGELTSAAILGDVGHYVKVEGDANLPSVKITNGKFKYTGDEPGKYFIESEKMIGRVTETHAAWEKTKDATSFVNIGDMNGDGEVNNQDVINIFYDLSEEGTYEAASLVAEEYGVDLDEALGDREGDGLVGGYKKKVKVRTWFDKPANPHTGGVSRNIKDGKVEKLTDDLRETRGAVISRGDEIKTFTGAISGQESGGDTKAINPYSGCSGEYQFQGDTFAVTAVDIEKDGGNFEDELRDLARRDKSVRTVLQTSDYSFTNLRKSNKELAASIGSKLAQDKVASDKVMQQWTNSLFQKFDGNVGLMAMGHYAGAPSITRSLAIVYPGRADFSDVDVKEFAKAREQGKSFVNGKWISTRRAEVLRDDESIKNKWLVSVRKNGHPSILRYSLEVLERYHSGRY